MNTIKSCIGAALVAVVSFAPSLVIAAGAAEPREVSVYYDELLVNSDSGATALYGRLRSASRQVCAPFEGRELHRRALFKACYNQALSNAVGQVNRAPVTALHTRAAKGVQAS